MELIYDLICGDVGVRIRKERERQLSCVPVVVFRGEADLPKRCYLLPNTIQAKFAFLEMILDLSRQDSPGDIPYKPDHDCILYVYCVYCIFLSVFTTENKKRCIPEQIVSLGNQDEYFCFKGGYVVFMGKQSVWRTNGQISERNSFTGFQSWDLGSRTFLQSRQPRDWQSQSRDQST